MVIIFASDSNRVKLLPPRASHLARSMAQHRLHLTPEAVPSRCQRPDSQNKPEQITKYNTFNMTIKHNQDSLPDLATHDLANIALCDWCPNICRKQLPRRRQAPESQLHHRIADRRMLAAHAGCLPLPNPGPGLAHPTPGLSINCSHGGTGAVEPTYRALSNLSNFVEFLSSLNLLYGIRSYQLSQPQPILPRAVP